MNIRYHSLEIGMYNQKHYNSEHVIFTDENRILLIYIYTSNKYFFEINT